MLTFDDLKFFPFDCECLPNIFTCVVACPNGAELIFEVSERRNQSRQFLAFLRYLIQQHNAGVQLYMVGYNNFGYDWPLINHLLQFTEFTAADAYRKSQEIINTDWNNRFRHVIWSNKQLVPQLDLQKLHGFEAGGAKATSLKLLQIAMEMPNVVEFELDFDQALGRDQIPYLIGYNRWDVKSTKDFLFESRGNIDMRLKIGADEGLDLLNKSDVDMGEAIVIEHLERKQSGITGTRGGGQKRTTVRNSIALGDLVFDGIHFETPQFDAILQQFRRTTVKETKGVFDGVTAELGGMTWVFGTGGIHAAKQGVGHTKTTPIGVSRIATERRGVITVDVSAYYPSIACENGLAPQHLGQAFVEVYDTLRTRKSEYKAAKQKMEETATKLSQNAVFGKGGSKFSCLSDPAFMLGITINGQLLLCVLAEQLVKIPTLEFIQANTDGITLAIDREYMGQVDNVVQWWEGLTSLKLDYDHWSKFFQRDVNNYLAIDEAGKPKGKGAFEWRIGKDGSNTWNKNQSCKIITIAVEEYLANGVPVRETIENCDNAFRFMQTLKVQKSDRVFLGGELGEYLDTTGVGLTPNWQDNPTKVKAYTDKATGACPAVKRTFHKGGQAQQRVGRFYAAMRGHQLYKIMQPLASLPHHDRPQAILKGVPVEMCNDVYFFDWDNLNRDWYVEQAEELIAATGYEKALNK